MHSRFDMLTCTHRLCRCGRKRQWMKFIVISDFIACAKRQHNSQGHDDYE